MFIFITHKFYFFPKGFWHRGFPIQQFVDFGLSIGFSHLTNILTFNYRAEIIKR